MSSEAPCRTVHLGLSKTATTSLQAGLFAQHSGIDYLGKYVTTTPQSFDKRIASIRQALLHGNVDAIAPLPIRADETRTVLLSDESLYNGDHRHIDGRIECLLRLLGPCRFMLTLREPVALMESLYLYHVLARRLMLQRDLPRAESVWISLPDWFEQQWSKPDKGAFSTLDYGYGLEKLIKHAGRDEIGVFLFEQLRDDEVSFYKSVSRFLQVDEDEGVRVGCGRHENPRRDRALFDSFKAASLSPSQRMVLRFAPRRIRKRLVDRIRAVPASGIAPQVSTPPEWIERIQGLTRPVHNLVVREWGLPLAQYGYVL